MILSSVIPASCAVIVVVDTRNREVDTGRRSRCGIAQVNRTWIAAADGAVSRYAAELEHVKCCDHSNLGVWFQRNVLIASQKPQAFRLIGMPAPSDLEFRLIASTRFWTESAQWRRRQGTRGNASKPFSTEIVYSEPSVHASEEWFPTPAGHGAHVSFGVVQLSAGSCTTLLCRNHLQPQTRLPQRPQDGDRPFFTIIPRADPSAGINHTPKPSA